MKLTKADGMILLGAIDAELESQYWRRRKRESYPNTHTAGWHEVERGLREEDQQRAAVLRTVADKIKKQLAQEAQE